MTHSPKNKPNTYRLEGELIGRYLLNIQPGRKAIDLYQEALQKNPGQLQDGDQKILHFVHKHPWGIGSLDAALALTRPHAELRRRTYLMFAILESLPEYADYFLPKKRSRLYIAVIGIVGIHAVLRAFAGLVLLKVAK